MNEIDLICLHTCTCRFCFW